MWWLQRQMFPKVYCSSRLLMAILTVEIAWVFTALLQLYFSVIIISSSTLFLWKWKNILSRYIFIWKNKFNFLLAWKLCLISDHHQLMSILFIYFTFCITSVICFWWRTACLPRAVTLSNHTKNNLQLSDRVILPNYQNSLIENSNGKKFSTK